MLAQALPAGTKVQHRTAWQPYLPPIHEKCGLCSQHADLPRPRQRPLLGMFLGGLLVIGAAIVGVPCFLSTSRTRAAPSRPPPIPGPATRIVPRTKTAHRTGKGRGLLGKERQTGPLTKAPEETAVRPLKFDPNPAKKPDPVPNTGSRCRPDPINKPDVQPSPLRFDLTGRTSKSPARRFAQVVRNILHSQEPQARGDHARRDRPRRHDAARMRRCTEARRSFQKTRRVRPDRGGQDRSRSTQSRPRVLFLDRLGDPMNVPLLETLTVRLLCTLDDGGFAYCLAQSPAAKVVSKVLQTGQGDAPAPVKQPRTVRDLAPENQQRLLQIRPLPAGSAGPLDNSNTQFATLALWIGRRYGVPVDGALVSIDRHYRLTQNADGGWGYQGRARQKRRRQPQPGLRRHSRPVDGSWPGADGRQAAGRGSPPAARSGARRGPEPGNERVALNINDPPSIKKPGSAEADRHRTVYFALFAGTDHGGDEGRALAKQDTEATAGAGCWSPTVRGRWTAGYGETGADTCFALLFLHKANLVKDLTIKINKLELAVEDKPEK